MALFGKARKEIGASCRCGCNCGPDDTKETVRKKGEKENEKGIKILGSGCAGCNVLEAAVSEALKELGMNEQIDHVKDFSQIASYGVMSMPALVVDGKAVSCGKALKPNEVVAILKKVRG